jgi:hypothetical protein
VRENPVGQAHGEGLLVHQVGHAEQARGQPDGDGDESAGAEHDRRPHPSDGDDGLDDPQRDAEGVGDVAGEVARAEGAA